LDERKKCPAVGSFGVAQSPKSSAGGTRELYILKNARQEKKQHLPWAPLELNLNLAALFIALKGLKLICKKRLRVSFPW
jgi:hypothetical protein